MVNSFLLFFHSAVVPESLPSDPHSSNFTFGASTAALHIDQSRAHTLRIPRRVRGPGVGNSNYDKY